MLEQRHLQQSRKKKTAASPTRLPLTQTQPIASPPAEGVRREFLSFAEYVKSAKQKEVDAKNRALSVSPETNRNRKRHNFLEVSTNVPPPPFDLAPIKKKLEEARKQQHKEEQEARIRNQEKEFKKQQEVTFDATQKS